MTKLFCNCINKNEITKLYVTGIVSVRNLSNYKPNLYGIVSLIVQNYNYSETRLNVHYNDYNTVCWYE